MKNNLKRFLSIALSIIMVLTMMPMVIFAADDENISTGEVIEIYSWDDLKALDARVEGGDMLEGATVKLMNDIDLYEMGTDDEPVTFNPIGANTSYFKGTFDGQGHTIKNMYQSGWALGYDWYNYGTIGLFSYLWDATIKNLTIENAECLIEGGNVAAIAGCAWSDEGCTFENITVKNSTFATYNNRAAGIVGYTGGEGTFTFKGITVDEDTVIAGLWGSFDSSLGGVVGSVQSSAKYFFEDVDVKCRLDAYNDVTAAYKYYAYRMCGMLIGRIPVDANNKPIWDNVILGDNVDVTFDGWANYTYINTSGKTWKRVEAGYAYDGVDVTQYPDATIEVLDFTSLVGGQQYGSYGQAAHEDIEEIILPAAAYAMIGDKGYWSLEEAVADAKFGDTIVLTKDYKGEEITLPVGVGLDANGCAGKDKITVFVAMIGDQGYTTLEEALEVANEVPGCYTIRLIADVDETFDFTQASNVNITIDGNGKAISGEITLNADAGELTITNAKIDTDVINYICDCGTELDFVYIASTCITKGCSYYVCSECGKKVHESTYLALGHLYDENSVKIYEATCAEVGYKFVDCSRCGARDATKTEEYKKKDHAYLLLSSTVLPTCETAGSFEVRACVNCGDVIGGEVIPAIGHIEGEDGNCALCGAVQKANGFCSCMCHSTSGIKKFIYKIMLFFWTLMDKNATCACGDYHY